MSVTIDGLSFDYRKPMTNVGKRPSGALTDYTLPIRITADTDIGGRCLATGNDLRFCLSDDTLLYAHKDYFSVVGGAATGLFWALGPSIASGSDLSLRCYYGNAGASAQANPTSAYDANHKAVYHLGDGSTLSLADATATGYTLTNNGTCTAAAGQVGGAVKTAAPYLSKLSPSTFPGGYAARSLSFWFKFNADAASELCGWGSNDNYGHRWAVYYNKDAKLYIECLNTSLTFPWTYNANWNHIAICLDGSGNTQAAATAFLNGMAQTLTGTVTFNTDLNDFCIGTIPVYHGVNFDGWIDEVRVMNINKPTAWWAYDVTTQSAEFLTWGAEEAAGASAFRLFSFRKRGDSIAKGR